MSLPTAENLQVAVRQVLRQTSLTSDAFQRIVDRYPDEESLPVEQDNKTMNLELKALGMEIGRRLRADLVICQIILMTWFQAPFLRNTEDLCLSYGFRAEDVIADKTLAEFVWFMEYALILVVAKGHMDFIINDVVAPLSEKLSGKRYPAGGGSETIGTVMRHAVFEKDTGLVRPKSRLAPTAGVRAAALSKLQHPLVVQKNRPRRPRGKAVRSAAARGKGRAVLNVTVAPADASGLPSSHGSEGSLFELIDFEGQSAL
jgi:hypothetical protein